MKLDIIKLEDKLFHIRIFNVNKIEYAEFDTDVRIEFEILDGPLAGQQCTFTLDAEANFLKER